jgi:tetratricopeptide (TPR) repeat protein
MRADLSAGLVVLTNSGNGHSIIPFIADRVFNGRLPGFAWMGYAAYNDRSQILKRDILHIGAPSALRKHDSDILRGTLSEATLNNIAYALLGDDRVDDALVVFARIVAQYPNSWNAHDSFGEALYDAKRYAQARVEYQRSLQLNPQNENARVMIKKIDALSSFIC